MTITTRLAITANMANGMLTTMIPVSLMYTDLTLTAFRIQEGRHSSELSRFKTVLLAVLFKPPVSLISMFLFSWCQMILHMDLQDKVIIIKKII